MRTTAGVGWLSRLVPRPRLRPGATGAPRGPIRRLIVLARLPNPTFDYYIAERLRHVNAVPVEVVDIRDPALSGLDATGAFVFVCRYVNASALRFLEASAAKVAGVAYFIDDDIAALVGEPGGTAGYRAFLAGRAGLPMPVLNRHLDMIFTSTDVLARRLELPAVRVLGPAPPEDLFVPEAAPGDEGRMQIAFHATGVHLAEHRFLRPVVERVLALRGGLSFEIFADDRARSIWNGLDGVDFVRPVSWPDYLARCRTRRVDLMLVPLVDSAGNAARAPTKRIDVARLGAAGLFSAGPTYGAPDPSADLRLPPDVAAWVAACIRLIDDPAERARLAEATVRLVWQMHAEAAAGFPGLPDLHRTDVSGS